MDYDEYSYPFHTTGYASTLPVEDDEHPKVAALYRVVKEVTGKDMKKPEPVKPRIGFY